MTTPLVSKIVERRTGRFLGLPFELDLLDQDLSSTLRDFGGGQPLFWGIALSAVDGSWNEELRLDGIDWEIRFYPSRALTIPKEAKGADGRVRKTRVKGEAALFVVATGQTDLNAARDFGRRAIRGLVALTRREIPLVLPAAILWEGAIANLGPSRSQMSMTEIHLAPIVPVTDQRLRDTRHQMAALSIRQIPGHVLRALEWLTLARSARVRPEKFIHLWLAVLALASCGQTRRKHGDMRRITDYTDTMTSGVAGVRSQLSVTELNARFRRARHARDALVHGDDDSKLTLELLYDLETAAFELVDFELAKLGVSLAPRS